MYPEKVMLNISPSAWGPQILWCNLLIWTHQCSRTHTRGVAKLSFDYNIEDNNNIPRDEFDEEFFTLIGDILVDIIEQRMEEETLIYRGGTDE